MDTLSFDLRVAIRSSVLTLKDVQAACEPRGAWDISAIARDAIAALEHHQRLLEIEWEREKLEARSARQLALGDDAA